MSSGATRLGRARVPALTAPNRAPTPQYIRDAADKDDQKARKLVTSIFVEGGAAEDYVQEALQQTVPVFRVILAGCDQ